MKIKLYVPYLFMVIVGLFASFSINAEMYKWVDENGNTHYSQTPPPDGIESKTIKPPPKVNTKESIEQLDKRKELLDAEREKRKKKEEEEKLQAEQKAKNEERCKLAQKRLKSYTLRPSVQMLQEDGSKVRATEEQRQEEIVKSREMINEFCN